ncbi:MAG: hypothetical protein V4568_16415, partial [Pseudomonadota bacterium]
VFENSDGVILPSEATQGNMRVDFFYILVRAHKMSAAEMTALAWRLYTAKVASGLLHPENEKMMQLQLAQVLQTLAPLFESKSAESYKVLLEVPVSVNDRLKIIDLVIEHRIGEETQSTAIELKCFRLYGRAGNGKRGAQNLGMYDYWADIENIENYILMFGFVGAYQLTLTDDPYYVLTQHAGPQVAAFSTAKTRSNVTGVLSHPIANRKGTIYLRGVYDMSLWQSNGSFHFISQRVEP